MFSCWGIRSFSLYIWFDARMYGLPTGKVFPLVGAFVGRVCGNSRGVRVRFGAFSSEGFFWERKKKTFRERDG